MPSVYEKVVSLIQKVPEKRVDFECVELIGWFRNKASVFQAVKGGKHLILFSRQDLSNPKLSKLYKGG